MANRMFDQSGLQACAHPRAGDRPWLGEVIATSGLLFTVGAACRTGRAELLPLLLPA